MQKGKFITFEGCEGVGKSTQLELLKNYLIKTNQKAVFTREPGGTVAAEKIREMILSTENDLSPTLEAYLFAASRADHVEKVIKPNLEKGYIVICDRFIDSSLAYQGMARGLGFENVLDINKYALRDLNIDCTVFIDMSPLNSWRKQKGNIIENDRMENEGEQFHSRVYEGYKKIFEDNSRVINIVPDIDKLTTHKMIIDSLIKRGMING